MTFRSQFELDDALRVGTVDQSEIDAFHAEQAIQLAEQQEAEALEAAQLAQAAEIAALAQLEAELAEAVAREQAARFAGQKSEQDLTPEELAALQASYEADKADFIVDKDASNPDPGFVEEDDGLEPMELSPDELLALANQRMAAQEAASTPADAQVSTPEAVAAVESVSTQETDKQGKNPVQNDQGAV